MDKVQQIITEIERLSWERAEQGKFIGGYCEAMSDVLKYIESLQKKPASKDLEEAAKSELQNHLPVANAVVRPEAADCGLYIAEQMLEMFEAGAKWQQEQFEKNRLAACDAQTQEEAEREWNFVKKMIKEEHRQPTYSDAIEYGRKLNPNTAWNSENVVPKYNLNGITDFIVSSCYGHIEGEAHTYTPEQWSAHLGFMANREFRWAYEEDLIKFE